ncbi:hypothetical protein SAMN04489716_7018 [Actinoplanes derwentensis]|uniref:Uncharacterized protein n=1 Tax=Actinoplanes derwentensis TaxID=113562 RepID=A0A1H2CWB3_9ACTN|nr:hypothetical protein SAMN04489716_7018 [Actinoplanes derwentensis]
MLRTGCRLAQPVTDTDTSRRDSHGEPALYVPIPLSPQEAS